MKAIAFHLQKGGVGKTTLSGTMAYDASLKGKTIIVDCDPQGNASSWFLTEFKHELADVLTGKLYVKDAIINICPNLDILPTFGLEGELKLYGETKLFQEPFSFCDLFGELEKLGYEYIIADLSPGIGQLEKTVLIACDEVITPLTPEYFSLDGIEIFNSEIKKLEKTMRKSPKHDMLILNAFDARIKQHVEIANSTKNLNYKIITIPVDPVFRKAQAAHTSPQIFGGMKSITEDAIRMIGGLLWR